MHVDSMTSRSKIRLPGEYQPIGSKYAGEGKSFETFLPKTLYSKSNLLFGPENKIHEKTDF